MLRRVLWVVATGTMMLGCDRIEQLRRDDAVAEADRSRLALSLASPGTFAWGSEGTVQITLGNQGDSAVTGVRVELYLPTWMDMARVEPPGTEVSVVDVAGSRRLTYALAEPPLPPGETRTVVQHVRVPPAAGAEPTRTDTAGDTVAPPPPSDRVLRARLVAASGEVLGAEVQTNISFRGATEAPVTPQAPGPPAGGQVAQITREGVGPVRLGLSEADLRLTAANARDTTWSAEGMTERGLVVPVGAGNATALLVDGLVARVIVRDRGLTTPAGVGVGSTLAQLSAAYGSPCAGIGEGRIAVWFANFPGVSFALSHRLGADAQALERDPSLIPDDARVEELWVHSGLTSC